MNDKVIAHGTGERIAPGATSDGMDGSQCLKPMNHVTLYVTRRCPLRCPYCVVPTFTNPQKEISVNEWKPILRGLSLLTDDFVVMGGEPLVYPHLEELLEWMAGADMGFSLTTSGVGMDRDRFFAMVAQGVRRLCVSIDTLEGVKDRWRNEKSKAGIEILSALKGTGVVRMGSLVIDGENAEEVPKVLEYFAGEGIEASVSLAESSDWGSRFSAKDSNTPSKKQIETLVEYILKNYKSLTLMDPPSAFEQWRQVAAGVKWNCYEKKTPAVDSNGDLWACDEYRGKLCGDVNLVEGIPKNIVEIVKADSRACKGCQPRACNFVAELIATEGPGAASWT